MSAIPSARNWPLWALGGAAVAGLAVLRAYEPYVKPFLPKCMLHEVTGLYCPGCGATRATRALLHGDLWAAWHWNPLFVISLPIIVALLLDAQFSARPLNKAPWVSWTIFAVVIVFGVVRNLPFAPCQALAPHPL